MSDLALIHEYLNYFPETGEFRWKKSPAARAKIGAIAGHRNGQGYREIEFKGTIYQAHRLAWLMVFGCIQRDEIDHINGITDDNRLCNLREATKSQNQHNRKRWAKGTASNLKGAYFHKKTGRWTSSISYNKKRIHLGLFDSAAEAHAAYKSAAAKHHGNFART